MESGKNFFPDDWIDVSQSSCDVFSQSGEDGILEAVFDRLGISRGYFVEFGAWDGVALSNTRRLLVEGWRGLYIESDARKMTRLARNCRGFDVDLVERRVTLEGDGRLDRILEEVGAPSELDLLSIDIDSDDLAVFRSLRSARAKVVVIEFNPSIPFDTEYENPAGRQHGNSALSITRYARSIDYDLIAMTETNLIFVDRVLAAAAALRPTTLQRAASCPRFFFGLDGSLVCLGPSFANAEPELFVLPWHPYRIRQPVPRHFRRLRIGLPWVLLNLLRSLGPLALTHPRLFADEVARSWGRASRRRQARLADRTISAAASPRRRAAFGERARVGR